MKSTFLVFLIIFASSSLFSQSSVIQFEGKSFAALSVANTQATSEWYQHLFGLQLLNEIKSPDGKVHVRVIGNDNLLLEIMQHADAKSAKTLGVDGGNKIHGYFKIGFYVKDLPGLEKYLATNNVEVKYSFEDKAISAKTLIISDINGQLIQLFERL